MLKIISNRVKFFLVGSWKFFLKGKRRTIFQDRFRRSRTTSHSWYLVKVIYSISRSRVRYKRLRTREISHSRIFTDGSNRDEGWHVVKCLSVYSASSILLLHAYRMWQTSNGRLKPKVTPKVAVTKKNPKKARYTVACDSKRYIYIKNIYIYIR